MTGETLTFRAPIEKYDFGRMYYSVVWVPGEITDQLDFSSGKRLRVDGEIQGVPFQGALMPVRGRWYLMVSKRLQRECRVTLGDVVNVQFDVANQDALDVPRELLFALEADDAAMRIWDGWTIGKRRGWCHRVDVAKRVETRERRVDEVLAAIAKEIAER